MKIYTKLISNMNPEIHESNLRIIIRIVGYKGSSKVILALVLLCCNTMAIIPVVLGLTQLLSSNLTSESSRINFVRNTQDALIENFPYLVSLRVNDIYRCSGSILSENKILTAAHCVYQIPVNHLSVRVGSSIHFDGEHLTIQSVQIHPTYNQELLDCDLAFLTLNRNLTFSRTVQPIELAERRPIAGTMAASPGWGMLRDGSFVRPDSLKVLTVRLINQEACRRYYPNENITNRMFCAKSGEFRGDPCQGGQGGPLVDKSTGKQIGVVSWGIACVQPELPIVYASVHNLIDSNDV